MRRRNRRGWALSGTLWGRNLPSCFAMILLSLAGIAAAQSEPTGAVPEDPPPLSPPGATPLPDDLATRLWVAYEAKGPDYEPRTEHLRDDGRPLYVNRLILEDSPYLIQHAHNPVDWYPWGPEAFEKARRENKPIFLSIGYSTCHWCHVMEKESFEHEETARLMNERFVSIKVDREQRPDVDAVYMAAVHVMGGRGGWPMSCFLTSDGKPFFGGTYYPRQAFVDLLQQTSGAWQQQRPQLVAQAEQVADRVSRVTAASGEAVEVGTELIAAAVDKSLSRHDERLGGFSPAPKFPHEPELLFLLERALRSGDPRALAAVETSLDHMARGGIYDQVGGGFHRYSTDARWLVPHFEKMLYNQAHVARAYLDASRLTGNMLHERVARQTLDYVLRDMTSPEGAFYSATDADSEGQEGEFFVWTPKEMRAVLPAADADLAIQVFGVSEGGNFEGKNILHLPKSLPEAAAATDIPLADLLARVDRIRLRLYEVREERIHPLRDDKIVTAWNGMMITTLARAGDALGEDRYTDAARRAAEFLWKHNRRDDGRLWRAHLGGNSSVKANHNDYAYFVEALITLYDVTGKAVWLERASALADVMVLRFWDKAGSGFFMSEDDHDGRLLVRPKSPTDGAIPSGNSVAVRAFAMLADRSGEATYRQKAQASLAAFSGQIRRQPTAFAYMLLGADELLHGGAGPLEYGARGVVRAKASLDGGRLTVLLDFAEGWHVNSNQPLSEELIPTRLTAAGDGTALGAVDYPAPELVTLGFQDEPLAVFQGTVSIRSTLEVDGVDRPRIAWMKLTIQVCDDEKCLKPEEMALELPVPNSWSGEAKSSLLHFQPPPGAVISVAAAALAAVGAGWWIWWRPAHS